MSTSTVSGTIQDPSGQIFANGTWQLIFKPNPNVPGLFTDGGVSFTTIYGGNLDATGNFSQANVNRNDTIAPAGSKWTLIVSPNANGQAYSVDLNINSGAFNATAAINAIITNITVPATPISHAYKDSEVIVPPNSGAQYYDNVNKVLKVWDNPSSSWIAQVPSGGSPTFAALTVTPGLSSLQALTASGNVTQVAGQNQYNAFKINNMLFVDGIKYTTIQAALNDLPAGGGCVCVPPGYSETLLANISITKSNTVLQFLGPANITLNTFIISVAVGSHNVSILSPYARSSDTAGDNLGVSFQGYTGSNAAVDIGAGTGFTFNFYIKGILIGLGSALANAIAIRLNSCIQYNVDDCGWVGGPVVGQKGLQVIGSAGFFAGLGRVMGFDCNCSASATNNIGMQFITNCNAHAIIGGHANMGGSANGSVAIDVASGASGAYINGFDADVSQTAITVESTVNTAVFGFLRVDSGTTNIANFGAGSFGNVIYTNGNLPFVDNGVAGTNSVINPARNGFRTDVWQNEPHATFAFFYKDLLDGGNNRLTLVNGVGGDTGLNSGSGGAGLIRLGRDTALSGVSVESAGTRGLFLDPLGRFTLKESAAPSGSASNSLLWADSTSHRLVANENNNGAFPLSQIIASGTSTLTSNAALAAVTSQAAITTGAVGALTTDTIEWCYASAPGAGDALCHVSPYVTAGNVNFVRTNPTAAAQNVSAIVINWKVIR